MTPNKLIALVVEDHQPIAELIRVILMGINVKVTRVLNKIDLALVDDIFQQHGLVDVVFLDLVVKNASGLTLLRHLKDRYPQIKVVVVSGENRASIVAECLNAGADHFIVKPFCIRQFTDYLETLLPPEKLPLTLDSHAPAQA